MILVDDEYKHLLPNNLDEKVHVILSKDTGGTQGIDSDPYEQFLQSGRQIWDRLEGEEQKTYGNRAKRGWELIDVVQDENSACCLCYTSGKFTVAGLI